MSKEQPNKNEQLFMQLISSYSAGAWIGMGKMKNPVSDQVQRNLKQAQFSINMLEMLNERIVDLSNWETEYLTKTINELKMNYVFESNRENSAEPTAADGPSEEPSETPEEKNRG